MDSEFKIPVHVSIIMDGNGRWAAKHGKERFQGHIEGVESVRVCTEAAVEAGVKYLSLYAFSEENWGRPDSEVESLMELMMKAMENELPVMMKNNVKFVVLGNRERLSAGLNASIDSCMRQTEGNTALTMVVFMSYSGRWDILQAARKIALQALGDPDAESRLRNLTLDDVSGALVTAGIPDPDLIIRTSGEYRLSNYLLWQGAYSEFLFTDVLWPDFRKEEFMNALKEFSHRNRRYGKI